MSNVLLDFPEAILAKADALVDQYNASHPAKISVKARRTEAVFLAATYGRGTAEAWLKEHTPRARKLSRRQLMVPLITMSLDLVTDGDKLLTLGSPAMGGLEDLLMPHERLAIWRDQVRRQSPCISAKEREALVKADADEDAAYLAKTGRKKYRF